MGAVILNGAPIGKARRSRLARDHVLVREQFYDNSRKRLWLLHGLVINNDHLNFENHKQTGTGDHGVVKVCFKFHPPSAPPAD